MALLVNLAFRRVQFFSFDFFTAFHIPLPLSSNCCPNVGSVFFPLFLTQSAISTFQSGKFCRQCSQIFLLHVMSITKKKKRSSQVNMKYFERLRKQRTFFFSLWFASRQLFVETCSKSFSKKIISLLKFEEGPTKDSHSHGVHFFTVPFIAVKSFDALDHFYILASIVFAELKCLHEETLWGEMIW